MWTTGRTSEPLRLLQRPDSAAPAPAVGSVGARDIFIVKIKLQLMFGMHVEWHLGRECE